MSIGGGILSASLLALFTFAACTAVPLVLKTLIGERLCSFVPVTNARRDFAAGVRVYRGDFLIFANARGYFRNGALSGFHP